MPRGVEHATAVILMAPSPGAIFPVMPRGVEHEGVALAEGAMIGRFFL